jgi:hypothetical protein
MNSKAKMPPSSEILGTYTNVYYLFAYYSSRTGAEKAPSRRFHRRQCWKRPYLTTGHEVDYYDA